MVPLQTSRRILCVHVNCQEIIQGSADTMDAQSVDTRMGLAIVASQLLGIKGQDIMG